MTIDFDDGRGGVSDETRLLIGACAGALVGSLVAYFVFTPQGRRIVAQVNPTLLELSELLHELRRALRTAEGVAVEARGAVEDVGALLAGAELTADV